MDESGSKTSAPRSVAPVLRNLDRLVCLQLRVISASETLRGRRLTKSPSIHQKHHDAAPQTNNVIAWHGNTILGRLVSPTNKPLFYRETSSLVDSRPHLNCGIDICDSMCFVNSKRYKCSRPRLKVFSQPHKKL